MIRNVSDANARRKAIELINSAVAVARRRDPRLTVGRFHDVHGVHFPGLTA